MRVKVDPLVCQGHGVCHIAVEDLYGIRDSDGRATVLLDPVPEELRAAARKSVGACPEQAITIVEDEAASPAGATTSTLALLANSRSLP